MPGPFFVLVKSPILECQLKGSPDEPATPPQRLRTMNRPSYTQSSWAQCLLQRVTNHLIV